MVFGSILLPCASPPLHISPSTQFAQAYHHCSKEAPPKMEERECVSSSAGVQPEAKVELFSHPEASYLEDATSHWGCRVARWEGKGEGRGRVGEEV